MILAVVIVVTLIVVVISPFFFYKGEALQEAASVNSISKLQGMKESLLKRYLEDEKAHRNKLISDSVWQKRKRFLTARYLDAARRLDYLAYLKKLQDEGRS